MKKQMGHFGELNSTDSTLENIKDLSNKIAVNDVMLDDYQLDIVVVLRDIKSSEIQIAEAKALDIEALKARLESISRDRSSPSTSNLTPEYFSLVNKIKAFESLPRWISLLESLKLKLQNLNMKLDEAKILKTKLELEKAKLTETYKSLNEEIKKTPENSPARPDEILTNKPDEQPKKSNTGLIAGAAALGIATYLYTKK